MQGRLDVIHELTVYPWYARETNPAYWSSEYIQRLAFVNYIHYVSAWNHVYINTYACTQSRSSQEALNELASKFYSFFPQ